MASSATPEEPGALPTARWVGFTAALVATAFMATSAPFVKLILVGNHVSPISLAFWRDVASFAILLAVVGVLRPSWLVVGRTDAVWMVGLGAAFGVLHIVWNLAVLLNGAAVAAVQQAAMPAIVAVAAWAIWREPITARKIVAIGLTFVGTVFVSGLDVLGQTRLNASGFVVGLLVPVIYAVWNLLLKRVRRRYNLFTTLFYGFGFGALLLLPFQPFTRQPQSLPTPVLLYFAGLVLIPSIVGFTIYTYSVGRLQASVVAILAMAEIPFIALYAYAFLGERLTAGQLLGAMLVAAGVLLLSWRRRKQAKPTSAIF
ncbi:MAG: DMT family transporter [Anaerolineae bacterium]|jgi:drug/metabolite transporter (DMT)-like permease